MSSIATNLFKHRACASRLSPFIFMTDPKRIKNPVHIAQSLDPGCAIIYRHFGKPDRWQEAERLRQVTFEREQQFLIGADPDMALKIGADGVHFRRDSSLKLPALWRKRCPDWLISMAGLKGHQVYQADLSVLDGLLLSSVFPSQSPSAGNPIGIETLSHMVKTLNVPIFALGGVNSQTVTALKGTGAAGFATVSGAIV